MDSNQMGKIKLNLKLKFLFKIHIFCRKGTKLVLEKEHIALGLVKSAIVTQAINIQEQRSVSSEYSNRLNI